MGGFEVVSYDVRIAGTFPSRMGGLTFGGLSVAGDGPDHAYVA